MKFVYNKNMKQRAFIKKLDLILPILFLLIMGCINTYGASFTSVVFDGLYIKQVIWTIASIALYFIFGKLNKGFIFRYSFLFYIFGLISLILVLLVGSNINGATSWFKVGGISIQPSEIFKPFYLIFLSYFKETYYHTKWFYSKLFLIIIIPIFLIFIEPDSGVAAMYVIMSLGVFLSHGINKKKLISIVFIISLLIGIFIFLYIYKKELLLNYLPDSFYYRIDRLLKTDTYQIKNALIGMGSSGLYGHGVTSLKVYIPEMISDFAFALIIMNFGYLMGILIIFIYTYLLFLIYKYMKSCESRVDKNILSGILFMMFFQCSEHIFMNLGLTPITGITLPFLSYGGSSLFSYVILFALIIKITTNNSSYS